MECVCAKIRHGGRRHSAGDRTQMDEKPESVPQGDSSPPGVQLHNAEDEKAKMSIDILELGTVVTKGLKAIGIMTVGQLEMELQDEATLQKKAPGCGPKSITSIRYAVQSFRAGTNSVATQQRGSAGANTQGQGGHSEDTAIKRSGWGALVALVVVLVLSLGGVLVLGNGIGMLQYHLLTGLLSFVAAVILFVLLPDTHAAAEGTATGVGWSGKAKLGGAAAAWLLGFAALSLVPLLFRHQTVQVYLVPKPGEGDNTPVKAGRLEIAYRRSYGPMGKATGNDDGITIQDLSYWDNELVLNRLECFGYVPAAQKKSAPPWRYGIINGEVTIQMVKIVPAEDDLPSPESVREQIKKQGMTEEGIRKPGKHNKREVSLRVKNASDVPVVFVAFDCIKAFDKVPDLDKVTALWVENRDTNPKKKILPETEVVWGNFDAYENPSGWFAVYVRYDDPEANRVRQQHLGVYNLFDIRKPRLVISRTSGPGIQFQVDQAASEMHQ